MTRSRMAFLIGGPAAGRTVHLERLTDTIRVTHMVEDEEGGAPTLRAKTAFYRPRNGSDLHAGEFYYVTEEE